MNFNEFFSSFFMIINEMSPYLLLGFLIAGILHVFVPKQFYKKYLSKNNKFSVLWASLLGIPLPLCSCGVIPTAIGLKNEKVSKGAVASFLIATPQTGIDSILATFSLMGLGFAIIRPVAALITGICGGILVNRLIKDTTEDDIVFTNSQIKKDNKILKVLHYAFVEMLQSIGLRLLIGLLLATLINVMIPDEFFLNFSSFPFIQMLVMLIIAVPMYICSTGSIPIAAALIIKGLSPGAALVMLMAGPAVNLASILVVKKSLGSKFTIIYLFTIIIGSVLFGLLTNLLFVNLNINIINTNVSCCNSNSCCCNLNETSTNIFNIICSIILMTFIINALIMNFINKFKKTKVSSDTIIYSVEGMNCNHCKTSVENAAMTVKGVMSAQANVATKTLMITGNYNEDELKQAIENAGFVFKGKKE